jgi:surfeit locus 1 family protein
MNQQPIETLSGSIRAPQAPRRSWLGLLIPALLAFIVLVGLGTWQVERKAWKEALIAALTERLAVPPQALPAAATWPRLDPSSDEYRRVKFTALFDHAAEALVYGAASAFRPDVSGPGDWVFTPARLAGGGIVMIDRGFVPESRQDPKSRADGQISGPVEIVGAMRWPEARHWFTPADDPAHNLWFSRDPLAIAAAKGLGAKELGAKGLGTVAPFYIEQEAPMPPGGLPSPGKIVVNLPNNHLQYAITWFGLALALAGVFIAWAVSTRRRNAGKSAPSPSL